MADPLVLTQGLIVDATGPGLPGTEFGQTKARVDVWNNPIVDGDAVVYLRLLLAAFNNLMPVQDKVESIYGLQVNSTVDGGVRTYGIANVGAALRQIGMVGTPDTTNTLNAALTTAVNTIEGWKRNLELPEQVGNLANDENLLLVSNGRDIKLLIKGNGDMYLSGNLYINGVLVNTTPPPPPPPSGNQNQENTITNGNNTFLGNANGYQDRPAQSFTLPVECSITDLEFKTTGKDGLPTGNWEYRIETDSASLPSGTLAHANASVIVTPQDNAVVKGTFATPFTLPAGTYWAVMQCNNQSGVNDRWHIPVNIGASVYSGGNGARYEINTWVAHSDFDYYFKVYATAV